MNITTENNVALGFTGDYIPWMKSICKERDILINNVSDLNLCYKNLTYEKDDIIKSIELYSQHNSTFQPFSGHWDHFLNAGNLDLSLYIYTGF